MSKRELRLLLEDILESIDKIISYVGDVDFDTFANDSKTVDAVVRNLEIIGEAAKQLPEDWKSQNRDIEWHQLSGIRNRIVHEYFGIDLQIIWEIIVKNLPVLSVKINKISDRAEGH